MVGWRGKMRLQSQNLLSSSSSSSLCDNVEKNFGFHYQLVSGAAVLVF